jgi:hypothetical protein
MGYFADYGCVIVGALRRNNARELVFYAKKYPMKLWARFCLGSRTLIAKEEKSQSAK